MRWTQRKLLGEAAVLPHLRVYTVQGLSLLGGRAVETTQHRKGCGAGVGFRICHGLDAGRYVEDKKTKYVRRGFAAVSGSSGI